MDDILTSAKDIKQLEARLKQLLTICRKRNMKITPSKFQVGSFVIFGGIVIEECSRRETPEKQFSCHQPRRN